MIINNHNYYLQTQWIVVFSIQFVMTKQSKGKRVNHQRYGHGDHVTDTNTTCFAYCLIQFTHGYKSCMLSLFCPWVVSILNMSIRKKRRVLFCGGGENGDARVGGPQDKDETETFSREDEGSQTSISDGILPSLGVTARSCRRITLRRFIISPFDPRHRFHYLFPVSFSHFMSSYIIFVIFLVYLQCMRIIFVWYNILLSTESSYLVVLSSFCSPRLLL